MNISQENLNKYQSLATIVSVLAVPVIVAVIGWKIQINMSEEGIKKDYVQMAAGILKDADKKKDEDLRRWAVMVLEKNSPVPFSAVLKEKMIEGLSTSGVPMPPESLMAPPPVLERLNGKSGGDLLHNILANAQRYHEVADQLRYLQEWIKTGAGK